MSVLKLAGSAWPPLRLVPSPRPVQLAFAFPETITVPGGVCTLTPDGWHFTADHRPPFTLAGGDPAYTPRAPVHLTAALPAMPTVACELCSAAFTPNRGHRFCSHRCAAAWGRRSRFWTTRKPQQGASV